MPKHLSFILLIFLVLSTKAQEFSLAKIQEADAYLIVQIETITKDKAKATVIPEQIVKDNSNELVSGQPIRIQPAEGTSFYPFVAGRKVALALTKKGKTWEATHLNYAVKADTFAFSFFLNRIAVDAKTYAEGLSFLLESGELYPNDSLVLTATDDFLIEAAITNAFFDFAMHHWIFTNRISRQLPFGFWANYKAKYDQFANEKVQEGLKPIVPQRNHINPTAPAIYWPFEVAEPNNSTNVLVYLYDASRDSVVPYYHFTPDDTCSVPTALKYIPLTISTGYAPSSFHYIFGRINHPFGKAIQLADQYYRIPLPKSVSCAGSFNLYTPIGDTLEGRVKNGALDGYFSLTTHFAPVYYPHISHEQYQWKGTYTNGKKNGLWTLGNEKHPLFSIQFKNDKLHGTFVIYHKGQLQATGSYFENQRTGTWYTYHPNGNLASEQNFYTAEELPDPFDFIDVPSLQILSHRAIETGLFNGACRYFYPNGEPKANQLWQNGMLMMREDWYPLKKNLAGEPIDTIYHTKGIYRQNAPWSGTFLVGARKEFLRGSVASHKLASYTVRIATYKKGKEISSEIILHERGTIPYIDGKPVTKKKKKRRK